jgi:hypothetical protein
MDCTWDYTYLNTLDKYYRKLLADYKERHKRKEENADAYERTFADDHVSFLQEALVYLWIGGFTGEMERYFAMLVKDYPSDRWQQFNENDYVLGRLKKIVEEEGKDEIVQNIVEMMTVAALANMAVGNLEETNRYAGAAEKSYNIWREDRVSGRSARAPNIVLPTFEQFRDNVMFRVLNGYYIQVPPRSVQILREMYNYQPEAQAAPETEVLPETPNTPGR